MSAEFAKVAHYVGVTNGSDLQAFAVGCSADACESVLRDFPGLIVNPKFKVGKELSQGEIEAHMLGPNNYIKVL